MEYRLGPYFSERKDLFFADSSFADSSAGGVDFGFGFAAAFGFFTGSSQFKLA